MNIENFIEAQYRELTPDLNFEFIDLYNGVKHQKLKEVLSTLHFLLIASFRTMNERLPTGDNTAHFWADPSRSLIRAIDIAVSLQRSLKQSAYAFSIETYYDHIMSESRKFLRTSGGSIIPENTAAVDLYYTIPIFILQNTIVIDNTPEKGNYELKQIGEGSYANVFKYRDEFYQIWFVVKRAKKDLNPKEMERFRREFDQMHGFRSPYIVDVYCYNDVKNEYIMEFMDCTLDQYITANNSKLSISNRKGLASQVLRAFQYIHSKGLLHRDISPKNILLKLYDDVPVVKVSDFGLVKIPDSKLTTFNTEFKGFFNDPALVLEGFDTYNMAHETYALTRLVFFIMTGRTNTDRVDDAKLKLFVEKGLSSNKGIRFKSIEELTDAFKLL